MCIVDSVVNSWFMVLNEFDVCVYMREGYELLTFSDVFAGYNVDNCQCW